MPGKGCAEPTHACGLLLIHQLAKIELRSGTVLAGKKRGERIRFGGAAKRVVRIPGFTTGHGRHEPDLQKVEGAGIRSVLVGGAVVAIYTGGLYRSGELERNLQEGT